MYIKKITFTIQLLTNLIHPAKRFKEVNPIKINTQTNKKMN